MIRRQDPGYGLGSFMFHVLGHLMIAKERNLIPVVDQKNYEVIYRNSNDVDKKDNVWEYFFLQPSDYTLEQVYSSKNVIIGSGYYQHDKVPYNLEAWRDELYIAELNKIFNEYIKLNSKANDFVKEQEKIFDMAIKSSNKVLGVCLRGSDYSSTKPKGHYIQPDLNLAIKLVKEKIKKWNIEIIFIKTEEEEVLQSFKNEFKTIKIIYQNIPRLSKEDAINPKSIHKQSFGRKNDEYLINIEYFTDMFLMSKCNFFIGGFNNGTMLALMLNNNKYVDKDIIDLGMYE